MRYFVIVRRVLALFHFDYNQGSPLVFVGLPIAQMSKDLHQDLYFEDLDNIWTIVLDILLQMSFLIDNIPVRVFFGSILLIIINSGIKFSMSAKIEKNYPEDAF